MVSLRRRSSKGVWDSCRARQIGIFRKSATPILSMAPKRAFVSRRQAQLTFCERPTAKKILPLQVHRHPRRTHNHPIEGTIGGEAGRAEIKGSWVLSRPAFVVTSSGRQAAIAAREAVEKPPHDPDRQCDDQQRQNAAGQQRSHNARDHEGEGKPKEPPFATSSIGGLLRLPSARPGAMPAGPAAKPRPAVKPAGVRGIGILTPLPDRPRPVQPYPRENGSTHPAIRGAAG